MAELVVVLIDFLFLFVIVMLRLLAGQLNADLIRVSSLWNEGCVCVHLREIYLI